MNLRLLLRRYMAIARMQFLIGIAYRGRMPLFLGSMLLRTYLLTVLWNGVYVNTPLQLAVTLPQMLTYSALSTLIIILYFNNIPVLIEQKIRDGSIAIDLIRPYDFRLSLLATMAGGAGINLLLVIFALAVTLLFVPLIPPASLVALFLTLLTLLGGVLVIFSWHFFIGLYGFWTIQTRGIRLFSQLVLGLASGATIPLWLFPEPISAFLTLLPFQTSFYLPLTIYIGQASSDEIQRGLALQVFWIAALWILGHQLWRRVQHILTVQGG